MSFHVYVEPELETKLESLCKKTGKKRNALVREALREYLAKNCEQQWPDGIFDFKPDPALKPFESMRDDLATDRDDIFARDKG